MSLFSCCQNTFATLSRAAAKAASSRFRQMGLAPVRRDWPARASMCERCHLRVIVAGVSYCGKPLLRQVDRDPTLDGCGCPTLQKAKSPTEHCPLDLRHQPARIIAGRCTCKWCNAV
ncbi:MAG TPA: hypothetical protein VHS31_15865 [Tepidisphaeraceae bacterium]|nr:hypothetical protein [Tepidisphaeraceae bacterium]